MREESSQSKTVYDVEKMKEEKSEEMRDDEERKTTGTQRT
jgi:hypothetical protein